MNDETTNAARLADWLEAGGDPPDDLDPDVLAVVYALQPDRAPKPRVSLDDILGGVTEGPFAIPAPTAAPAPEFPKGRESRGGLVVHDGERRDPAAPAKPARRGPSSFWMGPAFGIAFAAAAAAVFVFPLASKIKGLGERATMPEFADMAPAPTAAAPATGAGPTSSVPEMGTRMPQMAARDPEGARSEAPAAPTEPLERGKNAAAGDEALDAPKASNDAVLQKSPMLDTTSDGAGTGGMRPGSPPADLSAATTTAATTTPPATMSAPVYEEQAPARERSEDVALGYAESEGRVIAEADVSDDEMKISKAKKETESRRSAPSKSAASAPAPASAPAAGAAATTTTASARDVATPLDYNPSWYTSDATVTALYAGPLALEANGDRAGAAAAWLALISNGRTDVGQDAALRAAKDLRALGQNSEALRAVDSGLRRSSANTPFRAALYALRGDLFSAVGNNPQAEAAWKEAARLNMSR